MAVLVTVGMIALGLAATSFSAKAAGSNGTPDTAFNTNISAGTTGINNVQAIAVQSTGKILAFGANAGNTAFILERFNGDGTHDASFVASSFASSSVGNTASIVIRPDDTFFVGGTFTDVTQNSTITSSPFVAKFAADGTLDTAYSAKIVTAMNGVWISQSSAYAMVVDSVGRATIVGSFASWTYQFTGAKRIDALGNLDTSFLAAARYDASYGVAVGADDSVLLSGWDNAASASTVTKVLSSGSIDNTYISAQFAGVSVYSLTPDRNGKLLVGGGATGSPWHALFVRLNSDGSLDNTFSTPNLSNSGGWVQAYGAITQPDGKIVVYGTFTDQNFVTRLDESGTVDTAFQSNLGSSFGGPAYAAALTNSNEIVIGGAFSTPSPGIALLSNGPVYTVTYQHGTGATGANLVQTITQGSSLTLPSPTACPASATDPCFTAPAGQRPNNWQVTSGTLSSGSSYPMTGQSVTPTSNVTLAARWTGGPVQYSTTSFTSGGTSMASIAFPNTAVGASNQITVYAYNSGTASTSISNETVGGVGVTRQGGTCNASGGTIAAGAQCTLILQWNPSSAGALSAGSYSMQVSGPYNDAVTLTGTAAANKTVSFNFNGGSGTMSNQVAAFPTNLVANAFTRTGYSFSYWTLFSDGSGSQYVNQASYSFANNATMFANWSADSHVVTFNTDGGSSVANGSFNTDGSMNLPAAPTKSGYTFNGWFTAPTGGTALSSPYSPPGTSAITLYAQWSVDTSGGSGSNGNLPYTGNQTDQILGISGALLSIGLAITAFAMYRRRRA